METQVLLEVVLSGGLQVLVAGQPVELPRSRKTRALLTYLALESRPVRRTELCELLWENSDDPRAALRWSLSRLKSALGRGVLQAGDDDSVALNRQMVRVDIEQAAALLTGTEPSCRLDTLLALEQRFSAEPLAGLIDSGGVVFNLWLEAASARIDALHAALVQKLLTDPALAAGQRFDLLARRLTHNPLDDQANACYLRELQARRGLSAARKAFQAMLDNYRQQGQPEQSLANAWRALSGAASAAGAEATAAPAADTRSSPAAPASASLATNNASWPPPPDSRSQEDTALSADSESCPPLPEKPSIAVLDFHCLDRREDGQVLARGLTVDLNSRLARMPYFFVIARASSTRFSSQSCPPAETGRRLGVRYLLSGTTQRCERRIRVTVSLLDASASSVIWSEHYDRSIDDLFTVQDDISGAVIAAIEPAIELAEARRSLMKQPDSLNAWEYFHRGLWHCFHFLPLENETASELFASAIRLDPNFSRAWAGLSFTHFSRAFLNSTTDVGEEIGRAVETGQTSVALDSRDAMAHWSLGRALFLSRQHDQALACIDQALAINSNYAHGHYARGFIGIHAGQDESALPFLDSARRLSPFDPLLFAMKSSRGISLAHQGRFQEAADWALRATHEPNAHYHIYAIAAACLELAGRSQEAREKAGWVLQRRPDFNLEVFRCSFPHKDETQRRHFMAALQRAGIPGVA